MKKILILLAFIFISLSASQGRAQYTSCYQNYGGYGFGTYTYGGLESTIACGVTEAFYVLNDVANFVNRTQAYSAQIEARRNNLENYKSIQRLYTEGIPPFAPVGPDGRPRSPQITWQDVESIR